MSRPGEARNPNGHNQKQQQQQQQQQQRLYDPNQAQSNRQERQPSGAAVSVSATSRAASTTSSSSPNAAPPDGLVRLTKEIQALEKKVMEKPLRRTLDSDDDDGDYTRRGGNTGWSKRIYDSKR